VLEAKVAGLHAEFESAEEELNKIYTQEESIKKGSESTRDALTKMRSGNREPDLKKERKK